MGTAFSPLLVPWSRNTPASSAPRRLASSHVARKFVASLRGRRRRGLLHRHFLLVALQELRPRLRPPRARQLRHGTRIFSSPAATSASPPSAPDLHVLVQPRVPHHAPPSESASRRLHLVQLRSRLLWPASAPPRHPLLQRRSRLRRAAFSLLCERSAWSNWSPRLPCRLLARRRHVLVERASSSPCAPARTYCFCCLQRPCAASLLPPFRLAASSSSLPPPLPSSAAASAFASATAAFIAKSLARVTDALRHPIRAATSIAEDAPAAPSCSRYVRHHLLRDRSPPGSGGARSLGQRLELLQVLVTSATAPFQQLLQHRDRDRHAPSRRIVSAAISSISAQRALPHLRRDVCAAHHMRVNMDRPCDDPARRPPSSSPSGTAACRDPPPGSASPPRGVSTAPPTAGQRYRLAAAFGPTPPAPAPRPTAARHSTPPACPSARRRVAHAGSASGSSTLLESQRVALRLPGASPAASASSSSPPRPSPPTPVRLLAELVRQLLQDPPAPPSTTTD